MELFCHETRTSTALAAAGLCDIAGALTTSPLFQNLHADTLDLLASHADVRVVAKGSCLLPTGPLREQLILVGRGVMLVAVLGLRGPAKIVEIVQAGGLLWPACLFAAPSAGLLAEAECDTALICIQMRAVQAAMITDDRFASVLFEALSTALHSLVGHIRAITGRRATERIAAYLLDQIPCDGKNTQRTVVMPTSKVVVARLLGMSHESFSRALRELRDAGVIRVDQRSITIMDMKHLAAIDAGRQQQLDGQQGERSSGRADGFSGNQLDPQRAHELLRLVTRRSPPAQRLTASQRRP
ncbi:hypothetical protein CJ010_10940 [Azoarcus sp. DD4]|uniref:Crp/Fnr family transcriptional regulator n=1 Tax=Azoarcus sp. DD4 TaxID=2027405 RepID=UPI00112BC488|nr:Crp/Fnr family transcriptional regulator [Azoarcus sp. DD4]QDF97007.1 hypothetical protein CJ010_10940 [Azoarcus sp. DD4]